MAVYHYKALDGHGNIVIGSRVASSRDRLEQYFERKGITPVQVKTQGKSFTNPLTQRKKLSKFFRNLNFFLKSGMDLIPALKQLGRRSDDAEFNACIETIISDIEEGRSFADALAQMDNVFPPEAAGIIRVGEQTGSLVTVCGQLARYFKTQHDFWNKLYTLALYPAIVTGIGLIVSVFLFAFVLPRVVQLFSTYEAKLPLLSRILIGVSGLFTGWTPLWLLCFFVLVFIGITLFFKTESSRYLLGKQLLRLGLYRKIKMRLFCLAMGLSTGVGIDISKSLNMAGKVLGNPVLEDRLESIINDVREGQRLTESLNTPGFKEIPLDSLNAAEQSGRLSEVFSYHSDLLGEEVDEALSRLVALFEPALILFMALFVGLIVAGIMLPIFQLSGSI